MVKTQGMAPGTPIPALTGKGRMPRTAPTDREPSRLAAAAMVEAQ